MRGLAVAALFTAACGCGRLDFERRVGGTVDGAVDAVDAPAGACNPVAEFGTPVLIPELSSQAVADGTLRLLPDELTGYFWRGDPPNPDIFYVSRPTLAAPFTITVVQGINGATGELDPTVGADGVMVFRRNGPGDELYVTTQITPDTFSAPTALTVLNTGAVEGQGFLPIGSDVLYFQSKRSMAGDLYTSMRTGTSFTAPALITELATADEEGDPVVSPDGLTIWFRTNRAATLGGFNIMTATRGTPTGTFGPATLVANLNTEGDDGPSWISPDGCRMYLSSNVAGTNDVYVATRGP